MKTHALWLSASVLAVAWCGGAAAQTTAATPAKSSAESTALPDLVVVAERREMNLQKAPIAATVLTQADLIKRGVFTVDQLQFVSPSLTVDNFGQGNDFDIRGIGKGEHNTQTSTGVITYRDGVATFPGYIQEEPYFDIANIEVLRGPQGTFSGQNATGGAVIVTTNNPVIDGGYNGYLLGHVGNYSDVGAQGAINLPINDTLAARVAFNGEYRNSFYNVKGPWTGDPNPKWGSGRFSLLWTPTPQLKVLWKTDYDYLYNGNYFGDAILSPSGKVNPTSDLFNFSNNGHQAAGDAFWRTIAQIDYTSQSGIDFRSVTGFQQGKTTWQGDIDGTDSDPTAVPALNNFSINESVDENLFSQEFNIISPSNKPITWVLGAYYDNNDYAFPVGRFDIAVPPGVVDEELNGVNHTYTAAGFGQVSFNLPAGFQLQVGGRYSRWSTYNNVNWLVPEFLAFGINFHQRQTLSGDNFTGKVALNWNIDHDNFVYAFVATGAKPGGLNGSLYFSGPTFPPPFQQEYVTDYEIGWKSTLLDNHLRTQLGFYYNSFDKFQVIVPIPNNPTASTEFNNPNATTLYGFEASAQAVFGGFSLDAGLGIEHSSLGTFFTEDPRNPLTGLGLGGVCNPETGPANGVCINLGGHPQTYAPDVTFNVGGSYNYTLPNDDKLTPSISFSYISHQWGTLFDNVAAGDYLAARNILNASVAWTHGSYVATLYGTNLLNDHYVSALLSPIRLAGLPLQFGVSLMKTF